MPSARVEILSDKASALVIRGSSHSTPGVLIPGDNLYLLWLNANEACKAVEEGSPAYNRLNQLRNSLRSYLNLYKATLVKNGIPLPFPADLKARKGEP